MTPEGLHIQSPCPVSTIFVHQSQRIPNFINAEAVSTIIDDVTNAHSLYNQNIQALARKSLVSILGIQKYKPVYDIFSVTSYYIKPVVIIVL